MRIRALAFLGIVVVGASCTPARSREAARPGTGGAGAPRDAVASGDAATLGGAGNGSTRPVHKPHPAIPERVPVNGIVAPMKGEPAPAALAEARLVPIESCEKAIGEIADGRVREMRAALDEELRDWRESRAECWGSGLAVDAADPSVNAKPRRVAMRSVPPRAPPAPAPAASKNGDKPRASGTNNQVAGVDEADIVKTDGRFLYLAANDALQIVDASTNAIVSVTRLEGVSRELFVEGDRAVVYTSSGPPRRRCTYAYDCVFGGDGTSTTIAVYDIAKPSQPKRLRTIALSGSLIAARRIGNTVHTVTADGDAPAPSYETWPDDLEVCGVPEAVARAKFARLKAKNERLLRQQSPPLPSIEENGRTRSLCSSLYRTARNDGQAFTTVSSFDLRDAATSPVTTTIESRPGAVFASEDALYLSVTHSREDANGRWYSFAPKATEISEIHKFRLGARPEATRYAGSGVVPGHVLNQFAMDEWYGYLRVATTTGRVPDPTVASTVSVLAEGPAGNLSRVGAVENIARGEDIRAVRFDGDRGYVVTFKKTDPLFVVDLFDAARPSILGELKIPGFSTYIHRIDPDHLLSIGFDANDHGDFAYFDGVLLQLFDVKNPTDPRLVHKTKIGTRGSSSEAATDHLAFNYFADAGLLALPMTICEGGGDGTYGNDVAFSGLLVFDVDRETGFTRLGGVDHAGDHTVSCDTWWSRAESAVKRSVFIDDRVYSIASDRMKVQRLGRLGVDVADISLVPYPAIVP